MIIYETIILSIILFLTIYLIYLYMLKWNNIIYLFDIIIIIIIIILLLLYIYYLCYYVK